MICPPVCELTDDVKDFQLEKWFFFADLRSPRWFCCTHEASPTETRDMQLASVSFKTSQIWTSSRNLKPRFSTLSLNHPIQPFFLWLKNTYVYVCKYAILIYIYFISTYTSRMPISLSNILATCHLSKQQKQKQPLPPKQSPRIISCSSYASVSFRAYSAKTTHHPPSSVSGEPCRSFRSHSDSRCWRKCIETGVSWVWKGAIFVGDKGGTLASIFMYLHMPSRRVVVNTIPKDEDENWK